MQDGTALMQAAGVTAEKNREAYGDGKWRNVML